MSRVPTTPFIHNSRRNAHINVSSNAPHIRHGAQALIVPALCRAALAIFLVLGIPAAKVQAETTAISLTKAEQAQIEAMLTKELQRVVNAQKRIEGQGKYVTVKVRLDTRTEKVVIDLSKTYVPRYLGAEMEDLQHELRNVASELLLNIISIKGMEYRFDGKDIYHYFPEEWRPTPPVRKGAAASTAAATVVVAAGHGIYYHYKYKDWRAQRDPSNGITEDLITPGYATELSTWLTARSEVTPSFPRSTAITMHGPSGQPWWQVGARYHLQATYPENPEIWHSMPSPLSSLRERDEDIRSRPLFANHIGASTLLHLHTNAADPTATGTRAYYQNGRTADQLLGNNILCYMKELIQAKELYKSYTVQSQSQTDDNGETRLAAMPAVIVEIGFHTNPSDAAALQDPVFRTAAMKGVEKRATGCTLRTSPATIQDHFHSERDWHARRPHPGEYPLRGLSSVCSEENVGSSDLP